MSAGHRHRYVTVKPDGMLNRVLRDVTVYRTLDLDRARRSRFVYQPDRKECVGYRMSLLGLLHGLTGLTLRVEDSG